MTKSLSLSGSFRQSLSISVPARSYTKISPSDLLDFLKSLNILLIDVRDDDFLGGNIKNSIHLPAYTFEEEGIKKLEELLDTKLEESSDGKLGIDGIVFLSMYTSNRAPNCSSFFSQWMENKYGERICDLYVLTSGFHAVLKEWGKNSELIENYDSSLWNEELNMYKEDLLLFPGESIESSEITE